jgi:hypothetical protein
VTTAVIVSQSPSLETVRPRSSRRNGFTASSSGVCPRLLVAAGRLARKAKITTPRTMRRSPIERELVSGTIRGSGKTSPSQPRLAWCARTTLL